MLNETNETNEISEIHELHELSEISEIHEVNDHRGKLDLRERLDHKERQERLVIEYQA